MPRTLLVLLIPFALGACEELGIPDPKQQAAAAEAEGRAVGGACRHAGRALEDCYSLNPNAAKAAVFEGWRSMNDYMTENKIEVVPPTLPPPQLAAKMEAEAEASNDDTPEKADEADMDVEEGPPTRRLRSRTLRSLRDN